MSTTWDFTSGAMPAGAALSRPAGPWSRVVRVAAPQSSPGGGDDVPLEPGNELVGQIEVGSAADVPRFDYSWTGALRGLLYEPERTSVFGGYDQVHTPNFNEVTVTMVHDAGASLEGVPSADRIVATTSTGIHQTAATGVGTSISVVAGERWTKSWYVKPADYRGFQITLPVTSFANGRLATFDLVTGAIATDTAQTIAGMEVCRDGWVRAWITCTATATGTPITGGQAIAPTVGQLGGFAGDGTKGVLAWGPQIERGELSTLIANPTAQTIGTRPAETLRLTSPSGAFHFVFDDGSSQDLMLVAVAGVVTVPPLNRSRIRTITHTLPAITSPGRTGVLTDAAARRGTLADTGRRSATLLT